VARADLFRGATVVVTPTTDGAGRRVKRVTELWSRSAAGNPRSTRSPMTRRGGDQPLPHLVADALVDALVRRSTRAFSTCARGFEGHHAGSPRRTPRRGRSSREPGRARRALGGFRLALDHLDGLVASGDAPDIEARASTASAASGMAAVKIHVTPWSACAAPALRCEGTRTQELVVTIDARRARASPATARALGGSPRLSLSIRRALRAPLAVSASGVDPGPERLGAVLGPDPDRAR